MKSEIEHRGKVIDITPKTVMVEFLNKSACASCKAKGVCMASEEKIKIIEIDRTFKEEFQVGEEVNICLAPSMGYKAVWISYGIPLILLLILLLTLPLVFEKDLFTGLSCIVALVLYYLILYPFRNKIAKEFVFKLRKIDK